MHRPRLLQIAFLALTAGAVAGAALLQGPLEQSRRRVQINPLEELPAGSGSELVLLQAMPGGLRALAINYLWIRSQRLKEAGKLYDAKQLAEIICRLQPRFPGVWTFHSWNMAWNISVTATTNAERWHWVSSGAELLRDRGIPYNPRNLQLYKELSWLFYSKIGGNLDDSHEWYKRSLAIEFHRVLGAQPTSRSADVRIAWMREITEAPTTPAELRTDPPTARFLAELAALNVGADRGFLDAYNTWSDDPLVRIVGAPAAKPADERQQKLQALMTDPQHAPARRRVRNFVRRQVLTETYNMDTAWMLGMIERYGPLDWRLPWSHSLYWSTYGDHVCNEQNLLEMNSLNNDRNILNSIKALTSWGALTLMHDQSNPEVPYAFLQPELAFVDIANEEHIWLGQRIRAGQRHGAEINEEDDKTYFHYADGHVNFLIKAIQAYYLVDPARGEYWLNYIRRTYRLPDPQWNLPLEEFVIFTVNLDGEVPHQQAFALLLHSAIRQAYIAALSGDPDQAEALLDRAQRMYRNHQTNVVAARLQPPPIVELQADAAALLMLQELPILGAGELYRMLPAPIQRRVLVRIETLMQQRAQQDRYDFAAIFPAPPGMAEYRQSLQEAQ